MVPTPFFVSARPAQENDVFELRTMCMLMCTRILLALPLNLILLSGRASSIRVHINIHMALSSNTSFS